MALTKVSSGLMKPDNNLELEYTSQLGTTSVVGAATGYVVRTNYYDSNVTAGSGATFKFTGVTTLGKAGNVPNADGYFYDAVGRQFVVQGSPVDVKWFGAVGDGSDAEFEIQAAINHCQVIADANDGCPPVYLDGWFGIASTLTIKSAVMLGSISNSGARLYWTGAAGGTMVQKWATSHSGNLSFGGLFNISFRGTGGTFEPAILLDLLNSPTTIDKGFQISNCHFAGASDVLIDLGFWTNLHWDNLRLDGGGNYAIRAKVGVGQSLASFVINSFTYDNGGVGNGFLRIDNTNAVGNMGVVALKDARVELNGSWSNEKSFISLLEGAGTVRAAQFSLENIGFAEGATTGNFILYRDAGGVLGTEKLVARNIQFNSAADWTIIGGDLSTFQCIPATANYAYMSAGTIENTFSKIELRGQQSTADYLLTTRLSNQTFDRFQLRADGQMEWGNGAGAVDTTMKRNGAGNLRLLSGKMTADGGLGAGNSAAATTLGTVTKKLEIFDAAGASLGFVPIYNAIT